MKMNDSVPNDDKWGMETTDLDERYARQMFYGVCAEQAIKIILDDPVNRAEDLMNMPIQVLGFYLPIYMDVVFSLRNKRGVASDASSCFISILEKRASDFHSILAISPEKITDLLQDLSLHQDAYDAEVDIYGSFAERIAKLGQPE